MSDDGWIGVRVPATSANLGPGFDCLGLALGLYDEVEVRPARQTLVTVTGEGATIVPRSESHLILRAVRATLDELGGRSRPAGLALRATNRIPHGRGLGSSAAAITAGVLAALHLAGHGPDAALALQVACRLEGHPDNVAACLRGGLTISWYAGTPARPHVVRLDPHPALRPVAFIATGQASTAKSRMALPASVAHRDAAFNAARSALLVHALTQAPDLLVAATEDRLHQPYRLPAMPQSARLLDRLRTTGVPAVLSGSGPTVLALTRSRAERDVALSLGERDCGDAGYQAGYQAVALPVDAAGAVVRGG
ncbi:MAG: homoserine kinase [Frankiaceae bacterium]